MLSGKVLAAVGMPFAVAAAFGGILVSTNHTIFPAFRPPADYLSASAPVAKVAACMRAETRFAGIAVNQLQSSPGQLQPSPVTTYHHITTSPLAVLEIYNSFPGKFDSGAALQAVKLNALPLIQLNPGKLKPKVIQEIASGRYDKNIKNYADQVRGFKRCIAISLGHEMNGWWYRWGQHWNTPATFIKAWRRVHTIFAQEGATNVIWSWDPSHQYQQVTPTKIATPAKEWYPGAKYVNWIGLDGYLGSDNNRHLQSFDEIFGFQLHDIKQFAPHKLVYLAETGVNPGPSAARQVTELFAGALAYHLAGLVWFDAVAKHDYRLGIHKDEDMAYQNAVKGFVG